MQVTSKLLILPYKRQRRPAGENYLITERSTLHVRGRLRRCKAENAVQAWDVCIFPPARLRAWLGRGAQGGSGSRHSLPGGRQVWYRLGNKTDGALGMGRQAIR